MKFYILNTGRMITPDDNVLAAMNTDQLKLVIVVPAFLLDHPQHGLVLIDTGFCYDHIPDAMKKDVAWSPLLRIRNQIEALGYRAEDVRHVVLSHLHFDHAGQMCDFPHATFHMRKSEWDSALPPSRSDYFPQDYEAAQGYRFEYLSEQDNTDIFGDGSLVAVPTSGHSKGHSSFLVTLPKSGRFLLTMDAAHIPQYFLRDDFFADSKDPEGCKRSIEKLRLLQPQCDHILYGHDPGTFARMKMAPEYYE